MRWPIIDTPRTVSRLLMSALLSVILASSSVMSVYAAEDFDPSFFSGNDILFYSPESESCIAANLPSTGGGPAQQLTVPLDFTLGTDKSMRPVNLTKKLMEDYNLTDIQAAGIVGNFMWESGGNHVPPDVNEGGSPGPPSFDGGYGWAQWTGGRQITFIDYSVSKGYMASKTVNATDAANYAYLNEELSRTGESKVIPEIKKAKSVEEAVVTWEKVFERANPELANNPERIKRANSVIEAIETGSGVTDVSGTTPSTATGTDATDCTSSNTAVQTASGKFGEVTFPLLGSKSVVTSPGIFANGTTNTAGHPYTAYDIMSPADTKVVAFASGTVKQISDLGTMGHLVGIYNKDADMIVAYIHLNADLIAMGTDVIPGDPIGSIGSVQQYPDVNADHLHIDAEVGSVRDACSRSGCASSIKAKFRDIGPDLYNAYQKLPD